MKILTIIVPTYNMEKCLDKCLASLNVDGTQLMESLEVLVVNDGSKDRSLEIAGLYEKRSPETYKIIDKENGNYGSCINCALKEASGKYVKILDADDTFDTPNFKMFLSFLKQATADCIISDYIEVNSDEQLIRKFTYVIPTLNNHIFTLSELGQVTEKTPIGMHSVCYKTSMLREMGYFQTEGISYTDNEWACFPLAKSETFAYFDKILYRYCIGREGQSVSNENLKRGMWMIATEAIEEIKMRENLLCHFSADGLKYVNTHIRNRVRAVYRFFFITFGTEENNEVLKDFDQQLLSCDATLYHELGETMRRCIVFHYLKRGKHMNRILFI